jgi:hypothetical protein
MIGYAGSPSGMASRTGDIRSRSIEAGVPRRFGLGFFIDCPTIDGTVSGILATSILYGFGQL